MSAAPQSACWSATGIFGDRTCPELATQVHCRNCPAYAAGAARLLDVEVSAAYLADQARRYAQRKETVRPGARSVVIFRLAAEWLALPTTVFVEIAPLHRGHSLPHRRDRVVTGLVNVRGELLVRVSLAHALGLAGADGAGSGPQARLAVIGREGGRFAFPADEIAGLRRFDDADLAPPPATLAHAPASFARGMLRWHDRAVGVLDDAAVFQALNRSLA